MKALTLRTFLRTLVVAGATILAGCSSTPGTDVQDKTWFAPGKRALTQPIALLADTQFHESRGVASRYFGLSGDEIVPVTVRTGEQVIGAGDLLTHALRLAKHFPLKIHLGDAIDMSCETEWSLFKLVMTAEAKSPSAQTWLFAPGNHDGYQTGNFYPKNDGLYVLDYWSNVCNAGQLKIDNLAHNPNRHTYIGKARLLQEYLSLLGKDNNERDGQVCADDKKLCFAFHLDAKAPWQSHLIQLVQLPAAEGSKTPVYALLLDSSDYDERPYLTTQAGVTAGISSKQLQSAQKLLGHVPAHGRFFFATHHPAQDWKIRSWPDEKRALWSGLNADTRSLRFLVSAHSHTGWLHRHSSPLGPLTELNTGSLSDAPLYIRSLQFETTPNGSIGFKTHATTLDIETPAASCSALNLPEQGTFDYGINTQQRESDRASTLPPLLRSTIAIASALGHLLNFWDAKHEELRPQLLAYADVVEGSMPEDQPFEYIAVNTETALVPFKFSNRAELLQHMRAVAWGRNNREKSAQAKGNLLLRLEDYYWRDASTPQDVKNRAHRIRLCLALRSAAASPPKGGERSAVLQLAGEIATSWSSRLDPPSGKP